MGVVKNVRIFTLLYFLLPCFPVEAGLDKFTVLDRYKNWIIERRVSSKDTSIRCRASIPNYYSWFGGRIHLDNNGELVIPGELVVKEIPNKFVLNNVREILTTCRKDLIYSPNRLDY